MTIQNEMVEEAGVIKNHIYTAIAKIEFSSKPVLEMVRLSLKIEAEKYSGEHESLMNEIISFIDCNLGE